VLNQIRNQFTIRSDEGVISLQDERLAVAQQWLAGDPGAQDVFNLWETSNPVGVFNFLNKNPIWSSICKRQHNLLVSVISVLAALLPLLSSHYTYHALGYPIVKTLLTPQWMRKLNSYIGGAHNELILVTLKLLIGISGFAGGKEKKSLLEAFQWEIKVCLYCILSFTPFIFVEFAEIIVSPKKRQNCSQPSRKTRYT
jgi:nucleolar pre-ribosomal-associated protein 1